MTTTKEKIIKVATEMFANFGYNGVSMSDLSNKLGITKAALYYHFMCKDTLFVAVLNAAMRNFCSQLETVIEQDLPLEEKLRKFVITYIRVSSDDTNIIRLMKDRFLYHKSGQIKEFKKMHDEFNKKLFPLIEEMFTKRCPGDCDIDMDIALHMFLGALNIFVIERSTVLLGDQRRDENYLTNQIIKIILPNIGTNK